MKTVVLGPPPMELAELIAHRRASGADLYDEVWEGEYHMAPAPSGAHADLDDQLATLLRPLAKRVRLFSSGPVNLGGPTNYRVPDRVVHRERPDGVWFSTAVVVVEIVSPDDETCEKLSFYAACGVEEALIVDPHDRSVAWLGLSEGSYHPIGRSLLGITAGELAAQIEWPPVAAA
jgi:Uma2 family endonuclease